MKKKSILRMSVISALGLIGGLANSTTVNDSVTIDQLTNTTSGLLVNESGVFDGSGKDLTISGKETYTYTDNSTDTFGVLNIGTIKNIAILNTESLLNYGSMEVGKLVITDQNKYTAPANGATIFNVGENASLTIKDSLEIVAGGLINNLDGATMRFSGKNIAINTELDNIGATMCIDADLVAKDSIWNTEGGLLKIADGVTVTLTSDGFANAGYSTMQGQVPGGTVLAGQATFVLESGLAIFRNTESAEVGAVLAKGLIQNSGNLTINNKVSSSSFSNTGEFIYNGTDAVVGNVTNSKTIYATTGVLSIEGDLSNTAATGGIWKNKDHDLTDIIVSGKLTHGSNTSSEQILTVKTIDAGAVEANDKIVAEKIISHSGLKASISKSSVGSFEAKEYVIGASDSDQEDVNVIGYHSSGRVSADKLLATMTVHNKITFDASNGVPTLTNRGDIYFDGETALIEGEGTLLNEVFEKRITNTDYIFVGNISKNSSHEDISNLVIKSEFVNQGEIYAQNLSVKKGVDGIEQSDGTFTDSHGFNVSNLTVLDGGDFSLQSSQTNLKNLTINENAVLHATKTVELSEALTGRGTLDVGTGAVVNVQEASSVGTLKGSGTVKAQGGALIQSIDDFSGQLRLGASSGIGVDALASGSGDSVTLTLPAGYSFGNASVVVGKNASSVESAGSTLTMLDGTSIAIVVGDGYNGSSLVVAPTATVSESTKVFVYNAASLADGTLVIETTQGEAPTGYEVLAQTDNLFKVIQDNKIVTLSASEALGTEVVGGAAFAEAMNSDGPAAERVAMLTTGNTAESATRALNSIALMGTSGAAQAVAVNAATMAADTIEQHGSRLAAYTHDEQGGDLWVTLNGNFSRALNYKAGTSSYGFKSDLAGATIGSDYAFGNGVGAGVAFTFGTGSARGQGNAAGTKNDIDYYGLHLYGVWNSPYVNLIGHVGYGWTENEISQGGYKGSPDVTTITAGIRAEKPIAVSEIFTVTPHIGIRYLNVDMDSFTAGGFEYGADTANLVQIPVGVAFSGTYTSECGAVVKPYLDLQVSPLFGDDEATNTFAVVGGSQVEAFEARIANSAMYSARIGLETQRNGHSLALSYNVGLGVHDRVDQALQAKYRFSF